MSSKLPLFFSALKRKEGFHDLENASIIIFIGIAKFAPNE